MLLLGLRRCLSVVRLAGATSFMLRLYSYTYIFSPLKLVPCEWCLDCHRDIKSMSLVDSQGQVNVVIRHYGQVNVVLRSSQCRTQTFMVKLMSWSDIHIIVGLLLQFPFAFKGLYFPPVKAGFWSGFGGKVVNDLWPCNHMVACHIQVSYLSLAMRQ